MVDLPVKVSHGMRKNQGIFERFRVPKKVKGNSFTFSEVLPYESSFDLQPYDS